MIQIREATAADTTQILNVHACAFGQEKGAQIAALVGAMLDDDSGRPSLSLVAVEGGETIGHILFTRAELRPAPVTAPAIRILAPLAVLPAHQRRGVGAALIETGLSKLNAAAVDVVFVLGHPDYYPRHGFRPAHRYGLEAPYPIAPEHADAWMLQALHPAALASLSSLAGKIHCCATLDDPAHWRE